MNGYVWELTQAEKDANELAAVQDMCFNHPENEYWRNRLEALTQKTKFNTGCDPTCGCIVELADPRTADQEAWDEFVAETEQTREMDRPR